MAQNQEPLGPPENTAQRSRRLKAEAQETQSEENQITKIDNLFENPDGTDNRVYDAESGAVIDDTLTDDQADLFASMVEEVESHEVIDLGDGAYSNAGGVPPKPVAEKVNRPNRAERQVVTRPPEDPTKVFVLVQALDDVEMSVGYNEGKTFKLERDKVYKVPRYVALWGINQKYFGPPPSTNWLR